MPCWQTCGGMGWWQSASFQVMLRFQTSWPAWLVHIWHTRPDHHSAAIPSRSKQACNSALESSDIRSWLFCHHFPTAGSASAKKERPKSVTPTRSAQKNTFRQVATIGRKFSGRIASWPLACENAIKRYPKWAGCQLWPSWHWEAHCHLQTPSTPQSAARASRTWKKLIKSYCRSTHWRSYQSINQSTSTTTSEIYWVEKTCKGAFIDMSSGFCIKDVAKGHQGFTGFTQMDDDPTMTGHKTFQDRPREALQLFCNLGLAFTWRIIIALVKP